MPEGKFTNKLSTQEINNGNESKVHHEEAPVYPERILELVRSEAIAMLSGGQTSKQVQFGWEFKGGNFWLSKNPDEIVDPKKVEVDGHNFYFGIFNK